MALPPSFMWGVSTAAYQIEGSTAGGGRSRSDWDEFADRVGAINGGDRPDPAADHYKRWPEDVDLLRRLGVNSYRFSVSWTRLRPEGTDQRNPAGAAFYDQLVDELMNSGITPMVTIAHMELPLGLSRAGGWNNRQTIDHFMDYVNDVHTLLGDRVSVWSTLNEVPATTWPGYGGSTFPPALNDVRLVVPAIHNQLVAHGRATEMIRRLQPAARIGLVGSWWPVKVGAAGESHVAAARLFDKLFNRIGIEPLLRGEHDPEILEWHEGIGGAPFIEDGDLEAMSTPIDYFGLNYYGPVSVVADAEGRGGRIVPADIGLAQVDSPGAAKSAYGWEIEPEALAGVLERFRDEYALPVIVTENGIALDEPMTATRAIHDIRRIEYHRDHLAVIERCIENGVDVRGYFPWTLMDNFDWAGGYEKRFGLVHIDFETQTRTPKSSFSWYSDRIARETARSSTSAGATLAR